ncbi:MAG TPA: benzoate-CoA ligase family protein [Pyrinomonadaceae bacterium]
MNLVEYVFSAARASGRWHEPAVVCGARRLTYAELWARVLGFGGALRAAGVTAGARVALVAHDCPDWLVTFLGAAAAGAVCVPASTMLTAAELAYVLTHSGATAAVCTRDQLAKLQQVRHQLPQLKPCWLINEATGVEFDGATATENASWCVDFDAAVAAAQPIEVEPLTDEALAFLLYTSGSTGRPKGVMHVHRSLPYTCETFCRRVLGLTPADRVFSSSRLFFAYGLGNSLSFPLASAATSILCAERPTPAVIAAVCARQRPTVFCAVPAVYRALLEHLRAGHALDTTPLRLCISAGEKLPATLCREWRAATALDILDGIGSTEMLQMFISNTPARVTPGSSGRVVPGYEAKLLDGAGRELTGAGTGDLYVKGGSAFVGYWRDAEKTNATIAGDWVRTGDIYRRDAAGDYWFEGRGDDMFKVKGLWVAPVEVEEALLSCTEVAECAVVPGADEAGLAHVVAHVVLKGGAAGDEATAARLRAEVAARLPAYKCPAQIHFAATLPRTATGKLQRYKLRQPR